VRCYLPRTGTIVVAIATLIGLLHGPAGHAVAAVGVVTAALAVSALVAGVLTGITLAARRVQRRRAEAGGCVTCSFDCQYQTVTRHGTAPTSRRPLLVTIHSRAPQQPELTPGAAQDEDGTRPDRELVPG
jgi:hypothetical protein